MTGESCVEPEIDETDRRILAALQRRGRMTSAELAEAVNLSPSACHRRVQRLEKAKVIRDYVALLDARKLGLATTVFVEIKLSGQTDDILDGFEKAVARVPAVLEGFDYAAAAGVEALEVHAGEGSDVLEHDAVLQGQRVRGYAED